MDPVADQAAGFNLSSPLITFDLIARQGQNSHLACVLPVQTRVCLALMETTDGAETVQAIFQRPKSPELFFRKGC